MINSEGDGSVAISRVAPRAVAASIFRRQQPPARLSRRLQSLLQRETRIVTHNNHTNSGPLQQRIEFLTSPTPPDLRARHVPARYREVSLNAANFLHTPSRSEASHRVAKGRQLIYLVRQTSTHGPLLAWPAIEGASDTVRQQNEK